MRCEGLPVYFVFVSSFHLFIYFVIFWSLFAFLFAFFFPQIVCVSDVDAMLREFEMKDRRSR